MGFRKGKQWEAFSRGWLEQNYPGFRFFKLINPERIDWLGFGEKFSVMLVESKHCNKRRIMKDGSCTFVYYSRERKRNIEQLQRYISTREYLESLGYTVKTALLICKGPVKSTSREIVWAEFRTMDDIKTSY